MKKSFVTIFLILSALIVRADFRPFWIVGINPVSVLGNESVIIYKLSSVCKDTLRMELIICGGGTSNIDLEIRDYNDSLLSTKRYNHVGKDSPILIPLKTFVDLKIKAITIRFKETKADYANFKKICEVRFDDGKNGKTLR